MSTFAFNEGLQRLSDQGRHFLHAGESLRLSDKFAIESERGFAYLSP
jgi:hypothetical protein